MACIGMRTGSYFSLYAHTHTCRYIRRLGKGGGSELVPNEGKEWEKERQSKDEERNRR